MIKHWRKKITTVALRFIAAPFHCVLKLKLNYNILKHSLFFANKTDESIILQARVALKGRNNKRKTKSELEKKGEDPTDKSPGIQGSYSIKRTTKNKIQSNFDTQEVNIEHNLYCTL